MPRAFVTGATGFLGTNLILALLEDGWEVTGLHRASSRTSVLEGLPVRRTTGDVTDAASLLAAIPEGIDAVFHTAADLSFWSRRNAEQERINVGGTRNVVEAALARGARRLVHTSSIAAYGLHDGPVDETTVPNATQSKIGYLRTKALAEVEVRAGIERGLDATILNPANILGPYDRTGWAAVIRQIHAGTFPGAPPGRGSFCHAREVARMHLVAYAKGESGGNYLLGGADASYLEMARIAAELCGKRPPRRAAPAWLLSVLARLATAVAAVTGKPPALTPELARLASREIVCRSRKAERALGYRPAPLAGMLRDSHRWLVDNGLLRTRA